MDIDALRAARRDNWNRLHTLCRKGRLSGAEIDELAALYRQGTADLADVRALSPDTDVIRQLSADLAQARGRLTGTQGASAAAISRWFRLSLPSALYQIRWWTLGVMGAFIFIAAIQVWWLIRDPHVFTYMGSASELEAFAKDDFVAYYSQDTHAQFGASVWLNNALIAVECVGAGVTGIFPVYVLINNAISIGQTAAVVIEYGGWWHFFRFILPHGIPELTAIFIAGAAGLRVFWTLLVPGSLTRGRAVGIAGRTMVTVAGGLVILLFVSGVLEGFVTPSALPDWFKITLGALVTGGVWVYTWVIGGNAYKAGYTGDVQYDAGYEAPTAA
ncbi:stage II sporulation protein M [Schaalia suimastitidis]|uniref:stage II sporulation protein M n=1 Tax=Schaalia suimastitidis TaxID=121163 RepID=UPI000427CB45|nr:stage II sporulation protein M [Schaalia suimastitidis]